jgi:hypothetical protein
VIPLVQAHSLSKLSLCSPPSERMKFLVEVGKCVLVNNLEEKLSHDVSVLLPFRISIIERRRRRGGVLGVLSSSYKLTKNTIY